MPRPIDRDGVQRLVAAGATLVEVLPRPQATSRAGMSPRAHSTTT